MFPTVRTTGTLAAIRVRTMKAYGSATVKTKSGLSPSFIKH